jgi:two-component system, NtrC family, sensor kinase
MMPRSLFGKTAAVIISVLVIALSVYLRMAQSTGYRLLSSLSQARAESIASIGVSTVEHLMLTKERHVITHLLRNLIASRQVVDAVITDADGHIRYTSDTTHTATNLDLSRFSPVPEAPHLLYRMETRRDSLREVLLVPLPNRRECRTCHAAGGSPLGYFVATVPLNDLKTMAAEHRRMNIGMSVAIFSGLGVLIGALLFLFVLRPVNSLRSYVQRVEEHIPLLEEGTLVPLPQTDLARGRDEIASLIRSFRALVIRLNDAHERIHDLHAEQLSRADQLATVGEMAAGMAHEIRNPVAGVRAALQVFRRDADFAGEHADVLDEMILQLDRINHAVDDLLSYARMSPPDLQPISANEVIRRTAALLASQTAAQAIRIRLDLTEGGDTIQADSKQMQQVLLNILLNAMQAMDEGGDIVITSRRGVGAVSVWVQDSGRGIPAGDEAKIFKPFYTTRHKGTGLGLAICRTIMERHGGDIRIESTPPQGSRVHLRFPTPMQG